MGRPRVAQLVEQRVTRAQRCSFCLDAIVAAMVGLVRRAYFVRAITGAALAARRTSLPSKRAMNRRRPVRPSRVRCRNVTCLANVQFGFSLARRFEIVALPALTVILTLPLAQPTAADTSR